MKLFDWMSKSIADLNINGTYKLQIEVMMMRVINKQAGPGSILVAGLAVHRGPVVHRGLAGAGRAVRRAGVGAEVRSA